MANTINLKVYKQDGSEASTIAVSKDVFGFEADASSSAMYNAVLVYRSNTRQGTAKTKKRHEVSGGGKKPWRQKGTGRARAGSIRSPLWVGGGTVFGPAGVQNFKIKQNKKEHLIALKSALTLLVKDIVVLDSLKVEGKTKDIVKVLTALKLNDNKVLLVSEDDKVLQGTSNIPSVLNRSYNNVSVYDLLNTEKLVITKEDLKKLEEELD
ncbi:MAG: 50S ribosomal protein L4 [Bacilli bacterium]|jgi:large subunit ribosomal protein L4